MQKPVVRRKPIDPALIEKTCNTNNYNNNNSNTTTNNNINNINTNISNTTDHPSSCTSPPTSSMLHPNSSTSFTSNPSPHVPTPSNLNSTSPKSLTSPYSPSCVPSSKENLTSPPPLPFSSSSSSNVTSPSLNPAILRSSTMETSSRPPSTYSDSSSSSNPSLKKEKVKSASSKKQKAKKWFQETKAFIEGLTHTNDVHNEDEDKYIYFKPNCNFLDEPPSFPLEPLKLYDYTPPPWRIFQDHTDLQMMYKALKLNRDRLEEKALTHFRRANQLQVQVDQLTLALQHEKDHHAQTICLYEARIKAWRDRYDLVFNKWAQKEHLDSMFYYTEKDNVDPVARAALKCHAFETEIGKVLQRLVHAVQKVPLNPSHPIQTPTLPKVIPSSPSTSKVLPSTFLNAIMEPKEFTKSDFIALNSNPITKSNLVHEPLHQEKILETQAVDSITEVDPLSLVTTELEPTSVTSHSSSITSPLCSTLPLTSSPSLESRSDLVEHRTPNSLPPTTSFPHPTSSSSISSPPLDTLDSLPLGHVPTTISNLSQTNSTPSLLDSTSHSASKLVTDVNESSSCENSNEPKKKWNTPPDEPSTTSLLLTDPTKDLNTDPGLSFDADILDLIDTF